MINMEEKHFQIVKDILSRYDVSFFAFGSRIFSTAKKFLTWICYILKK
jgi:hypothetical protein